MSSKYFILSPGRSGSSVFCAVLYKLRFNFGFSTTDSWDHKSGSYEHPTLHKSFAYFHRYKYFQQIPGLGFIAKFFYNRASFILNKLLLRSDVFKSSKLLWLLPFFINSDYNLKLIFVIRDFESYSKSRFFRFGQDFDIIEDNYIRSYKHMIFLSTIYDSLILDFSDLVNGYNDECILKISEFLDKSPDDVSSALTASINYHSTISSSDNFVPNYSSEANRLYHQLSHFKLT